MQRIFLVASLTAVLTAPADAPPPASVDPMPIVERMMQTMGGRANWERVRYLRFDYVLERSGNEVARVRHLGDRVSGRYRVEWQTRDRKTVQVLFDVVTGAGQVWMNGAPAAPDEEKTYLEHALKRCVDDGNWLFMPWKLADPGAHLEYASETRLQGEAFDILHVTFDKTAATPPDQYWAYVNRSSHFVERWAYFPQGTAGTPALEKATAWSWQDWQKVGGGILLARERQQLVGVGEDLRSGHIYFPVLAVLESVEDSVFTSPTAPMPGEPEP